MLGWILIWSHCAFFPSTSWCFFHKLLSVLKFENRIIFVQILKHGGSVAFVCGNEMERDHPVAKLQVELGIHPSHHPKKTIYRYIIYIYLCNFMYVYIYISKPIYQSHHDLEHVCHLISGVTEARQPWVHPNELKSMSGKPRAWDGDDSCGFFLKIWILIIMGTCGKCIENVCVSFLNGN